MNEHNFTEFDPRQATPSEVAGYRVPGNLYKLGKACDEWLARRYALEGRRPATSQWYKTGQPKPPVPDSATKALAIRIRDHRPKGNGNGKTKTKSIKVPRDPKPKPPYQYRKRNRAKYATEAERREAKKNGALSRWNAMTPEQKAALLAKMHASKKPKSTVPRHKRPGWREYKREYDRQKRETTVLTVEQIEERRRKSRELYAKQAQTNPEKLRAQNAARRARRKAKTTALKADTKSPIKLAA